MSKVYIFDIDGTLTPSRRPMTPEFDDFFFKWANKNIFYLVSGSDLEKIKEQVPEYILELAEGIFTCGGNKFYTESLTKQWPRDWRLQYENKFKPSDDLLKYLEDTLDDSDYPVKAGIHIEDRGSMLNFSMVGRKCTLQERKDYFYYDELTGEREDIASAIRFNWSKLDAVIGGQISIDIYPKGHDKSQILKHIKDRNVVTSKDEYIFIGDRTMEGGNDYPLAKLMEETDNCSYYQTEGPEETKKILEKLSD